jgi:DNA-binding response OmpR family regulator
MAIAWVTMKSKPHLIESFRAVHWDIEVFSPAEFLQAKLSRPGYIDAMIFELTDTMLLDLCRKICHKRIAPILVIVANLAYAQAALEDGADDFVVEPINAFETLLRVRKLARATTVVRVGKLKIDLDAGRVSYDGDCVRLSSFEFRLLACLAKRVGQLVTYAELMEDVWAQDLEDRTMGRVKNCINRLRMKIEPDSHDPQYIITIPREGYRLRSQRQWKERVLEAATSDLMLYYDVEA